MKRILFTGGTGFIGRNVLPILRQRYEVLAPARQELDLFSPAAVAAFAEDRRIDVILHCANPNPSKNPLDTDSRMLRDSLALFDSVYSSRGLVEKLIYLGSGAVYDKRLDMVSVTEEEAFRSVPADDYGFAKYIMNRMTGGNVYDLCVLGCYGPGDAPSKFITHCIRCCLRGEPITIRQDCLFDYLHVTDLGRIMAWLADAAPRHHMYNACSGHPVSLRTIAETVKAQMDSPSEIVILRDGRNRAYTASNARLMQEYPGTLLTLEEGIARQIDWEREHFTL